MSATPSLAKHGGLSFLFNVNNDLYLLVVSLGSYFCGLVNTPWLDASCRLLLGNFDIVGMVHEVCRYASKLTSCSSELFVLFLAR